MAEDAREETVVIKKYANRRLYNTTTSSYVTLDDLANMVREGHQVKVVDARTERDITRSVFAQIIFEQEAQGEAMLPVGFLQELIRLYGGNLQSVVPNYLDMSMKTLLAQQERFREGVTNTLGRGSLELFEEQAKRNVEFFERALRMMSGSGVPAPWNAARESDAAEAENNEQNQADVQDLRNRVEELTARLDALQPQHTGDGEKASSDNKKDDDDTDKG
jgi:polyhydroxyalkanoate synthesis repressor PhaR